MKHIVKEKVKKLDKLREEMFLISFLHTKLLNHNNKDNLIKQQLDCYSKLLFVLEKRWQSLYYSN